MIAGVSKLKLRARAGKSRLGRGPGPEPGLRNNNMFLEIHLVEILHLLPFLNIFQVSETLENHKYWYLNMRLFSYFIVLEIANDLLVRAKKRQSNGNTVKSYWSYKQVN